MEVRSFAMSKSSIDATSEVLWCSKNNLTVENLKFKCAIYSTCVIFSICTPQFERTTCPCKPELARHNQQL